MKKMSLLFCIAVFQSVAWGITDPSIPWRMIRTPHFVIIYDARQKELAERYAEGAESAYAADTKHYAEAPDWATLTLIDAFDVSNGDATNMPYPKINAYPVLPSNQDNISVYGDWARELVLHEYVHILSFEPAHGFWRPLRWVLGSVATPTALLPRWYLEGIAVDMETRESHHGRLRSPYYHAIMRAMAEDRNLDKESLARTNESGISWPGDRPYVLGSFLVHEMNVIDNSTDLHPYLIDRYSARVPYFLSAPLVDRTEQNYEEAYASMVTRVQRNTEREIALIDKNERTISSEVGKESLDARSPVISPDGQSMVYFSSGLSGEGTIIKLQRDEQKVFTHEAQKLEFPINHYGVRRLSWHPDSQKIIYNALDYHRRYYYFSDIYEYNFATQKRRQLTHGLRATDVTYSPDGQHIAFRQNLSGTTRLAQVDAEGKKFEVLYTPKGEARISWPEFISDHEIAFSERTGGAEHLKILDLHKKTVREVLAGFEPQFLRQTSKGLLFASDKTGIMNIYRASKDLSSAVAITNITTRAIAPQFDEQTGDLYFTRLNGSGIHIERVAAKDVSQEAHPPKISLPETFAWTPTPQEKVDRSQWQDEEYSAWKYMIPRYLRPFVFVVDGGIFSSVSIGAVDPVGHHAYQAQVFYDSYAHIPSWAATYQNAQTAVPTTLFATDQFQTLYATGTVLRSTQAYTSFDIAALLGLNPRWAFGVGWEYYRNEVPDYLNGRINDIFVFRRTGPSAYLVYTSASQSVSQVSPEKGYSFRLDTKNYIQSGDLTGYDRYGFAANTFISDFLPEHHTLMLQANTILHPRIKSSYLGSLNAAADYLGFLSASEFVTRGYPTATFLARDVATVTAEYRFAITKINQGGGTNPIFTRRLYGAVVSDAATLEGYAYNYNNRAYDGVKLGREVFWGIGTELKADFTISYHLPITVILGLYYGAETKYTGGGFSYGLGLNAPVF